MPNPKNQNQTQELIARLRNALKTRTWVNLPEDILQACSKIEELEQLLAANQQLVKDLEQELEGYKGWSRSLNEALNSGDGSYRP